MPEKLDDQRIREKLSSISRATPAWEAIMAIFDNYIELCQDSSCQPELNDSQRQFNTGRLSSAIDIKSVFNAEMDEVEELRNEQRWNPCSPGSSKNRPSLPAFEHGQANIADSG